MKKMAERAVSVLGRMDYGEGLAKNAYQHRAVPAVVGVELVTAHMSISIAHIGMTTRSESPLDWVGVLSLSKTRSKFASSEIVLPIPSTAMTKADS